MSNYNFEVLEKKLVVEGTDIVIPDRKVIMRKDNNKVLSIMSDKYQLTTHASIIDGFENALDAAGPLFKKRAISTVLPYEGARMYRKYIFDGVKEEVAVGDVVSPTLELWNSYDGTLMVGFQLGAFRMVCTNGLMVPETFREIMKKHYVGFDIKGLVDELQHTLPVFDKSIKIWKEWHKEAVTVPAAVEILAPTKINKKEKELIAKRFEDDEEKTKWGLFQAATWVISHDVKAPKKEENTRIRQIYLENELAEKVFYKNMQN
jgi:hypothetical protein